MKSFTLSLLFFILCLHIQAQETYRKEKMNVMGTSYSGYSTTIPFNEERTKEYLSEYLKSSGKISERKNYIEVKETSWKSKDDPKVYALVVGDSTKSKIWIGYSSEAQENITNAIQAEIKNMPPLMQKYHLQHQIKEAEEAASYLSKEIRNSERDENRLHNKLEQNSREKLRLEQALEQNGKDKIQLEQDLITNGKVQEEKNQALEEVQKQLQYLKERAAKL